MSFLSELEAALGKESVVTEQGRRRRLSRDFYRYSQVLEKQLCDYIAEAIVFPKNETDVLTVAALAVEHGLPVTARGAGTGNYGQAVPISGGVVLDMTRMNQVLELGKGFVRAEAGARLGRMENHAREHGWELHIFPSTYVKSTIGGFVAGGSGGIGSVTHGQLWDNNVLGCRLVTAGNPPRVLELEGEELSKVIHAYGTTGIMTEVTIPLAPKVDWTQLITFFPTLELGVEFADSLTHEEGVTKRLVSVSEARIAPLLNAGARLFQEPYENMVLLWVAKKNIREVSRLAAELGGRVEREILYEAHPKLSDLSWNHTTLWARKVDMRWTYLQAAFLAAEIQTQIQAIKKRYGNEVLLHFEYIRAFGEVLPAGLPLLYYKSAERIKEIIEFMESIGVSIANPHTYLLEEGGRKRQSYEHIYAAKRAYDPANIFNPGKLCGPLRTTL